MTHFVTSSITQMAMVDSRKRVFEEFPPSSPSKQSKINAYDTPTATREAVALNQLQSALLCVLELQSRTLERFRTTGDWLSAHPLLVKTEVARRAIVQERRKVLLERELNASLHNNEEHAKRTGTSSSKRVTFNDVVDVQEAVPMDRSRGEVSSVQPEEVLMVKTMGLQSMPMQNFSEFWS
ncbi:unnamed protein product [Aphanomyces euteiches]